MNDNKSDQYTQNYMISFAQAQNLILENTSPIGTESIGSHQSFGRVLAENIISPVAIPPFDNSAMDGYAVNAADLKSASNDSPTVLELIGLSAAGDGSNEITVDTENKAWKIMTGAPVPNGFDSIIPVENTQLKGNQVSCFSAPKLAAHIRKKGEDYVQGKQVLDATRIINANVIMSNAALGIDQVKVYQKINIAIFSTGKELVDDPKQELKAGQIRNSNKPFILDWFQGLPVNAFDGGTNYDEVEEFEEALKLQLDKGTQIIISSGAVSMGDFDFIPQTIKKLGGNIIFHKSTIRPGKPILFAKFPNGSLYFGLPGNPISAAVGLRFFVSTAILNMLGLPEEQPISAIALNGLNKKSGLLSILKANGKINSKALFEVNLLKNQESFKIQPLLHANGWGIISENKNSIQAGDLIHFYPSSLFWE